MSMFSTLKKDPPPKPLTEVPDFASWQQKTLAQVATDMFLQIKEHEYEIQNLRQDLKAAINAYREVLTK
jgi:hypothetical protein